MQAATVRRLIALCVVFLALGTAITPAHSQTKDVRIDLVAQAREYVSPTGNGETVAVTRVETGDQFYIEGIATPNIASTTPYTVSIEYDSKRLQWFNATIGGIRWTEQDANGRNLFTSYSYNQIVNGEVARLRLQLLFNVLPSVDRTPLRFVIRTKDRERRINIAFEGELYTAHMPLIRK